MLLKKTNAFLSIIIMILLIIHAGYESAAFCLMYYHPLLSKLTGYFIAGMIIAHAVISVIYLFVLHDSKSVSYIKLNIRTVLQRICAILMMVLLPVHIYAFDILSLNIGNCWYVATEALQVTFYAAVVMHIAVSFDKSLITLGKLENEVTRHRLNIVVTAVCLLSFFLTCVITISTHIKMFYG